MMGRALALFGLSALVNAGIDKRNDSLYDRKPAISELRVLHGDPYYPWGKSQRKKKTNRNRLIANAPA